MGFREVYIYVKRNFLNSNFVILCNIILVGFVTISFIQGGNGRDTVGRGEYDMFNQDRENTRVLLANTQSESENHIASIRHEVMTFLESMKRENNKQINELSNLLGEMRIKISTEAKPAPIKVANSEDPKCKTQRNELSKLLNNMKQKYGQQSCEQARLKKQIRVSEFGGWCQEVSGVNSSQHRTDESFVRGLSKFLANKTVASFGDGPGMYKAGVDALGEVTSYTAFDGAPFAESATDGRVSFMDLSAPQFGRPIFDWVLSFEVAEHIPAEFEAVFLDNIVRHARTGIVLSWAVPGQKGYSHVNNKALEDVVTLMKGRGFALNDVMSTQLRSTIEFPWIKRNVRVYIRIDPKSINDNEA